MTAWGPGDPGVLSLPSGRLIRGRGLRRIPLQGAPPEFGIFLLAKQPPPVEWESRWVRWPDFRLPSNRGDAEDAWREAWRRSLAERAEIACDGGRGRIGTALACVAVLDGVTAAEVVAYVRERYDPRAIEAAWQRWWYIRRFASDTTTR